MSNSSKGGSKLLTAIISFLLGFFFAILVEVGAIFGVGWFVMNKDLDSVLSAVGIHNTDENGNKKYINTDTENGGVKNLRELFAGLQGLVYENGEVVALGKSFDDFSQLVPATDMLLGMVYNSIDQYIELDKEEFESTPLSGLAQVLSDSIMNIRTAAFLDKLGMQSVTGDDANKIVKSLLMGAETEYATVYYGGAETLSEEVGEETPEEPAAAFRLPVLYDIYTYNAELDRYFCTHEENGGVYPANLNNDYSWLDPINRDEKDGETIAKRYMLYYVPCRVTETGIREAEYIETFYEVTEGTGDNAKVYKLPVIEFGDDTDFIVVKPDGGRNFILNYNDIYAALNANSTGASDRFTGYSYYEDYARNYYNVEKNADTEKWEVTTISGKNYFRNNDGGMVQLDPLLLSDIVNDSFAPLDSVLVTEVMGDDKDLAYDVFKNTSLGALMRGEVDFNNLVNDMAVSAFINNVSPDNKVMAYIVYKLSDMEQTGEATYTAVYDKYGPDEKKVTVQIEGGHIAEVVDSTGTVLDGVKVKDVAKLAQEMTINVVMDARTDEKITVYICYGVAGVKPAEAGAVDSLGNPYQYTGTLTEGETTRNCYLSVRTSTNGENTVEYVTSAWYIENGEKVVVSGTKVSDVSKRVDTFTKDLAIGDVINLEETDNMILKSIKDTKINKLDDKIQSLKMDEIFKNEEIEKNAMLRQLKGTKVNELATAIDELLIQTIYADEVYKLPDGDKILEVVEFNTAYNYYVMVPDTANAGKFKYESVGQLTQTQFDNRGKTVYCTYGADEGTDGAEIKIVFDTRFLYFEYNAEKERYDLTEVGVAGLTDTDRDDRLGKLTQTEFANRGATKYYSYGMPQSMWKLVLYKNQTEKGYTINNFNNMVAICANNVNSSTLLELREAGILSSSITDEQLNKKLTGMTKSLGEMTLAELITAVIALAQTPAS